MDRITVVTSFSERGRIVYGQRFVDSFKKHWPESVHLAVFHDSDLAGDPEHVEFCRRYAGPEFNHPRDWNMMAVKFCHKVFAMTSALLPKEGWRVWVDADVEWTAPVSEDWLGRVLPAGKNIAFLGRTGFMRPGQPAYSECGFLGFNVDNAKVRALLDCMRSKYTTGDLFKLGLYNWHDSYVFDHCRQAMRFADAELHNLSAGIAGTDVWPKTVLAEVSRHQKGPGRKMKVYGGVA